MPPEPIPQEIHETPQAIRATVDGARQAARRAAAAMRERAPRRVYVIGNGTSLYSSLAATYTARALASPVDPLVLAVPAGDFRYYTPAVSARDVVVGMSASGEFRDVLAVLDGLAGRCLRIGITHVPDSSLTRLADLTLIGGGGPSRVPVMTKTYASTLTAAHLLLLEFFTAPESTFADLLASADRCARALEDAEGPIAGMAPEVSMFEHAFYFGPGVGHAAALEGALKMKEMALLHAEGSETWEMASGPATMVSERAFCVALSTGGPSDAATADGARHAREWGARVIEIGPAASAGDWHLAVDAPAFEPFASLSLVPPMALLAYRAARARGLTPDTPAWRERYHAQGMTHILGE